MYSLSTSRVLLFSLGEERGGVKRAEEEEMFGRLNFAALAQFLLRVEMGAVGAEVACASA